MFESKLISEYDDIFNFFYLNSKSIIKTHFSDRKSMEKQIQEKDQKIIELEELIKDKNKQIQEKNNQIIDLQKQYEEMKKEKDKNLGEKESQIANNRDLINKLNQLLLLKENYQYFLVDKSNLDIFNFLVIKQKNKHNKFDKDPEFVASLSSADLFSVINPKENKNGINGLVSCVDSSNNKIQHSFTIELEKEVEVKIIKIIAFNNNSKHNIPYSFSYIINDQEEEFVSNDKLHMFNDEEYSKRIYCIQLNDIILIKKITICPKNDNLTVDSWPIYKRIEFYKSESDFKGHFESLIEKREDMDPHRCGVFISTSIFDLNNFYDINNNLVIITLGEDKPYFKFEITKGYAILTGFRFKKVSWNKTNSYKIIATDNDNKDDENWTNLYETEYEDSKELTVVKDILKPCPPIKFKQGKYVNKDMKESIHYYKEGSSFNNQYCKNNLGIIYRYGYEEIKPQIDYSIDYFEEAIRQKDDIISMYNLSHLYIYMRKL